MSDPARTLGDRTTANTDVREKSVYGIPYEWDEVEQRWKPARRLYGLPDEEAETV